MKNKLIIFSKYFLLGICFSHFGWIWETLLFLYRTKNFVDRGLLYFPICPIYGISIMSIYFIIGTLNDRKGILRKISSNRVHMILYLLLVFLLPTLFEFVTGFILDKFFDLRLWTYKDNRYNFNGYICLSVSLLWGIILYLLMKYLFNPFKTMFFKINDNLSIFLSFLLLIILIPDFIVNLFK